MTGCTAATLTSGPAATDRASRVARRRGKISSLSSEKTAWSCRLPASMAARRRVPSRRNPAVLRAAGSGAWPGPVRVARRGGADRAGPRGGQCRAPPRALPARRRLPGDPRRAGRLAGRAGSAWLSRRRPWPQTAAQAGRSAFTPPTWTPAAAAPMPSSATSHKRSPLDRGAPAAMPTAAHPRGGPHLTPQVSRATRAYRAGCVPRRSPAGTMPHRAGPDA